VYAVGHSTRTAEELVELLQAHGVRTLETISIDHGKSITRWAAPRGPLSSHSGSALQREHPGPRASARDRCLFSFPREPLRRRARRCVDQQASLHAL